MVDAVVDLSQHDGDLSRERVQDSVTVREDGLRDDSVVEPLQALDTSLVQLHRHVRRGY